MNETNEANEQGQEQERGASIEQFLAQMQPLAELCKNDASPHEVAQEMTRQIALAEQNDEDPILIESLRQLLTEITVMGMVDDALNDFISMIEQ